jgi:hypothetical protein
MNRNPFSIVAVTLGLLLVSIRPSRTMGRICTT